jgi:hypothetical protein
MNLVRTFFLLLLCIPAIGMARRPPVNLRFHLEGNPQDGAPFLIPVTFQPGNINGVVEKMPILTERDVAAVHPVKAEDGSYGCVFQFDPMGSLRLKTSTGSHMGSRMVAFVGDKTGFRQQGQWLVDKPIQDGLVWIHRGFTEAEITALKKHYRLIGHTAKPR